MQIHDAGLATPANHPACARDDFFLRVRFRAKMRRSRLPFDSSHTARALYPTQGHSHTRETRVRDCLDVSMLRDAYRETRVQRNRQDGAVTRNGASEAERSWRARGVPAS